MLRNLKYSVHILKKVSNLKISTFPVKFNADIEKISGSYIKKSELL